MHKYIWKILFIFFVINSLYIRAEKDDDNKNKGDDPCLHNIAMCSNKKLSKNKLSFIYDIWKNYETYKDIITNHQNKEMNKTFQLQDEAEDIKLMNHSLSMPMSFQFSTHTIILFKFWETLTATSYFVSLIICFIFGIISVILKVFRLNVERSLPKTTDTSVLKSKVLFKNNTIRMILSFIIYAWDYLLMLIVMTFNVGLFLSVVLGLSFGYFLFGNNFITCNNKTSASDMNVHKEFYGDPACCGC
ncbi:copper transporter [Plasmodium brasilianum]|uniref:Copper transport protein n=2 Tax=Plasmodium (Plasmodium) TaxID=418103 RepID=A0A1D3SQK9_PLAMA|nr:copper transporter, putative [Plasmodium malariae]KAI4836882.1 copper transporter [Plasmodium brasilianum]SCO94182.1 copper transporter, putative [Plasmodium malariae]